MRIREVSARRILNSKSAWTLEVSLRLVGDSVGVFSVPGGVSRGKTEAVSLPVEAAIFQVEKLRSDLVSREFNQFSLDEFLIAKDGTPNKANLGGNVSLGVSVAFSKAVASSLNKPLYQHIQDLYVARHEEAPLEGFQMPKLMMLMLEGGLHGSSRATIQEFMVIVDSLDAGLSIYTRLRDVLVSKGLSTNVGAEGAFSPDAFDNIEVLDLLRQVSGETPIALDIASSSFPEDAMLPDYDSLLASYPILSLEDPFPEDAWQRWHAFLGAVPDDLLVVADDITTTNPEILKKAVSQRIANSVIIKPNQVGTLTETLDAIFIAKSNGWKTVVSHRGSDTNDSFVADLSIGVGSDFVKFGAPARGERVAKYNRLLQIMQELTPKSVEGITSLI